MKPWEEYQQQSTVPTQSLKPWEEYSQASVQGNTSFVGRVKQDYDNRLKKNENIAEQYVAGNQSYPETLAQFGGQGAAFGSDVLLEGLKSAGNNIKSVTPDFIKKGVTYGLDNLGNTSSGLAARLVGHSALQKYGELEKEYPRAARNVEAAANIGLSFAPTIRGEVGSPVSAAQSLAKKGLDLATPPVLDAAKNTALYPIEGMTNFTKGLSARNAEDLAAEKTIFKKSAGAIRDVVKNEGVTINPQKAQGIASVIDNELKNLEFIPELSPKTSAIVNRISDAAKSEEGITLNKLDQYRRLLRTARDEDSVAAGAVRRAIDKSVNELQPTDLSKGGKDAIGLLNLFRKEYTQASKFEDIAEIVQKADGDPNKIKSGLNRFLNNEDNLKGFVGKQGEEELALLKKAAKYSAPEKILKGLGRFGYDPGNVFLPLVGSGIAGFGVGAPAALGLGISGTASRQLYKVLGRGKAEKLLQKIESGSKIGMGEASSLPPKVVIELQERGLIQGAKQAKSAVELTDAPKLTSQLQLPAPEEITTVNRGGVATPTRMTNAEMARIEKERRSMLSSGLTPDVRKIQIRNEVAKAYEQRDLARNAIKEEQIAKIAELSSVPIEQLVDMADRNIKELAEIVGKKGGDTAFAQALRIAVKNKKVKK